MDTTEDTSEGIAVSEIGGVLFMKLEDGDVVDADDDDIDNVLGNISCYVL
jgi:hypothetical protein